MNILFTYLRLTIQLLIKLSGDPSLPKDFKTTTKKQRSRQVKTTKTKKTSRGEDRVEDRFSGGAGAGRGRGTGRNHRSVAGGTNQGAGIR